MIIKKQYAIAYIIGLILLGIISHYIYTSMTKETFTSLSFTAFPPYRNTSSLNSSYVKSINNLSNYFLLNDTYPVKWDGRFKIQNPSAIWWQYPTFRVGSYAQLTNNLKYYNNPDNARCTPSEFCDAFYNKYKNKSNIVPPMTPINPPTTSGTSRVNYYYSKYNMLPFDANTPVLY